MYKDDSAFSFRPEALTIIDNSYNRLTFGFFLIALLKRFTTRDSTTLVEPNKRNSGYLKR